MNLKPQSEHLALAGFQPFFNHEGRAHATAAEICDSAGVPRSSFYRHAPALWTGPRRLLDRSERMSIRYDGVRCYVYVLRKVAEHWTELPLQGEANETTRAEEGDAPQSHSGELAATGESPPESVNVTRSGTVSTAPESVSMRRSESVNVTRGEFQIDTFDLITTQEDAKKSHKKRERPPQKAAAPSLCFKDLSKADREELHSLALETCRTTKPYLDAELVFDKFVDHYTAGGKRLKWPAWQARLRNWIRNERTDPRDVASPQQHDGPSPEQLELRAAEERAAKEEAASKTMEQAKLRKGARGIARSWPWLLDALKAEKEPRDAFDRCFHEWEATARKREFDTQDEAAAQFEIHAREWIELRAENRRRTRELKKRFA